MSSLFQQNLNHKIKVFNASAAASSTIMTSLVWTYRVVFILCVVVFLYTNLQTLSRLTTVTTSVKQYTLSPPIEEECPKDDAKFMEISGLRVIVTGMQHSGTTILSSIIMNAPCIIGAVDSGFLLAKEPSKLKNVHPFYEWLTWSLVRGKYGLTNETRDEVTSAPCFASMYYRLRRLSRLTTDSDDAEYCPRPLELMDKAPQYVYSLPAVMSRSPGVPVIVIMKEYEAVKESWKKRNPSNVLPEEFYNRTWKTIRKSQKRYPDRIMIVHYDEFNANHDKVMQGVFDFLGMQWDSTYLTMAPLNAKVAKFGREKTRPAETNAHTPKTKYQNK
jgi:hypothetical protein